MVEVCRRVHAALRRNVYGTDFDPLQPLYGGTCLPIPLYAIVACGIATGGNYLAGFAASMLLALATKNYCRAFCNGYGFDAIFRASLYLGLMPLIYAPALPLLLLLPLAVLLFRRTFREVVVATAGLLLPIFTACYVSWGSGAEFTAPLVTVGQSAIEGMPLQLFLDIPLPALVMAGGIVLLRPDGAFLFPGRHLCRRHQTPLYPLL